MSHDEVIRILQIVEYYLFVSARCIRWNLSWYKIAHFAAFIRTYCFTTLDITGKWEENLFVITLVVDSCEFSNTDFESCFFMSFSHNSFPWGFSDIESSTRKIPYMHIIAETEENTTLVIPYHSKSGDRKSMFHICVKRNWWVVIYLFAENLVPDVESNQWNGNIHELLTISGCYINYTVSKKIS